MGNVPCNSEEMETPVDTVKMVDEAEQDAVEREQSRLAAEEEEATRKLKEEAETLAEERRRVDDKQRMEDEKRAMAEKEQQRLKEQRDAELKEEQRLKDVAAETTRKAQEEKSKKLSDKKQVDKKKLDSFLKKESFPGDVNMAKTNRGKKVYPLHLAVKQKDCDMVEIMLGSNANIKQASHKGKRTALDKAIKYNMSESHRPIINVLKAAEQKNNLGA